MAKNDWIKIYTLNLLKYNPNIMGEVEFNNLKKSIENYSDIIPGWDTSKGYRLPIKIVVNDNNDTVVDGNHRVKALLEMGQEKIHAEDITHVVIDNEQKEKAFVVAIRNIQGSFDDNLLAGLLESLDSNHLDMTGFDDASLTDLLDSIGAGDDTEGRIDDDEIPEVKEARCTAGELWQLGDHRLYVGDATKKEDVEKLLQGEKADMVFTDPPYGVDYASKNKFLNEIDKGNRVQTPMKLDDLSEEDIQAVWKKAFEIIRDNLKETNSYYIFGPQIQGMMMMMKMLEAGLPYRHVIIWVKNNHVLGRCDYNYKHEPLFFGWTTKHKFYGRGEFKTSVWAVDKPHSSKLHPTMKPVRIVENALQNSSNIGSIVLDPFGGSRTTLIACEKLKRKCRMMEIDPLYATVILNRWEEFSGKKAELINGGN